MTARGVVRVRRTRLGGSVLECEGVGGRGEMADRDAGVGEGRGGAWEGRGGLGCETGGFRGLWLGSTVCVSFG